MPAICIWQQNMLHLWVLTRTCMFIDVNLATPEIYIYIWNFTLTSFCRNIGLTTRKCWDRIRWSKSWCKGSAPSNRNHSSYTSINFYWVWCRFPLPTSQYAVWRQRRKVFGLSIYIYICIYIYTHIVYGTLNGMSLRSPNANLQKKKTYSNHTGTLTCMSKYGWNMINHYIYEYNVIIIIIITIIIIIIIADFPLWPNDCVQRWVVQTSCWMIPPKHSLRQVTVTTL